MSEQAAIESAVLGLVQRSLQLALSTDPQARRELAALEGIAICVDITGLNRTVFALPHRDEGVRLTFETDLPVRVRITGAPLELISLARGGPAAASGVELSGDIAISQKVQRVLGSLDVDFEELLARRMGDHAARRLATLARDLSGWARASHASFEEDLSAFARFDAQWLPTRDEVAAHVAEVDDIRMATDRLEKRIERLTRRRRSD